MEKKTLPLWIAIGILAVVLAVVIGYLLPHGTSVPETANISPQAGSTAQAPAAKDSPCSIVANVVPGTKEVYIGWASSVATQGYVFDRTAAGESYHVSTEVPGWFRATKEPGSHTFVLQIQHDGKTEECSVDFTI